MDKIVKILAETTIKRTNIFFKDMETGTVRTRTEYYDTPELQEINISIHIHEKDFLPAIWSVNGEDWYHVSEYTYSNLKIIHFVDKYSKGEN